ncbi:MAG: MFS transporter [Myxococcota bacterium]|nr:MFS transporter [Myxococcota bacterium]
MSESREEESSGALPGARLALSLLVVVYAINFVDRQILSVLIEPIKAELGLSDTQLGFLTGFAFAVFYATLGVPIGRLADRVNRVSIISAAAALWSVMTALSGLAQNFWQLAAARIGVGVGEAGCTPPAHSMIADLFPPGKRASAMSIYQLGVPIGSVVGLVAGGWINEIWGWRVAFMAVGLPGLGVALALKLVVKDPPRGRSEEASSGDGVVGFGEALALIWQIRSFRNIAYGMALAGLGAYGVLTWFPAFLMRTYGIGSGEAASWLGPLGLLGGVTGTLAGGFFTDRLSRRDRRWYTWLPSIALVVGLPAFAWICLTEHFAVVIALLVVPNFLGSVHTGPTFAMTQSLAPIRVRAMASAIILLFTNLIGLGLGPLVIGGLSEWLEPEYGVRSLGYAMLIVIPLNIWAAAHYFWASRSLRAELDAQKQA